MKSHRTRMILFMLLTSLALVACSVFSQGTPSTPVVSQPGQAGQPASEATQAAVQLASPTAPVVAESRTRGPGDFSLLAPAAGLDALNSYQASLTLVFDGTRDGAPYQVKEVYQQVIDRAAGARLLTRASTGADGVSTQVFSAAVGGLRYMQPAAGEACRVSVLEENPAAQFEPAVMLPLLEGAAAAGDETINGVDAKVYSFDALALNAGPGAEAAGKLWVAASGGWVVKYELILRSDRLFGEGISGMQSWVYEVSQVDSAVASLPESCPQDMVELALPDGAQVTTNLPNFLQFSTTQSSADLAAFFTDTLIAQGWTQQGEPVESSAGTRLVFSRQVQDKEQMAVITVQASQDGSRVTIHHLLTDPVPAQ